MNIGTFSSILEIFAVFNFGYVVSDGFFRVIHLKFNSHRQKVRDLIFEIEGIFSFLEEQLKSVPPLNLTNRLDNNVEVYKNSLSKDQADFLIISKDAKEKIETKIRRNEFNPICLYFALYSIFLLFFPGVSENSNPICISIILTYSFFSFLLLLVTSVYSLICHYKSKVLHPFLYSNITAIVSNLIIIVASVGISYIFNLLSWFTIAIEWYWALYLIIILPASHFILFFFVIRGKKNTLCTQPLKSLNKFKVSLEGDRKSEIISYVDQRLKMDKNFVIAPATENSSSSDAE